MRLPDIPAPAWTLLGVLAGWGLGEGTRWVREIFRIRKLSAALRTELRSLLAQIKDKEDILLQGIQALKSQAVMPMLSVRSVRIGYGEFIKELYPRYSDLERNWASPDIPDTFDRCEDAIGGVRWNARNMQRSSSVRQ